MHPIRLHTAPRDQPLSAIEHKGVEVPSKVIDAELREDQEIRSAQSRLGTLQIDSACGEVVALKDDALGVSGSMFTSLAHVFDDAFAADGNLASHFHLGILGKHRREVREIGIVQSRVIDAHGLKDRHMDGCFFDVHDFLWMRKILC